MRSSLASAATWMWTARARPPSAKHAGLLCWDAVLGGFQDLGPCCFSPKSRSSSDSIILGSKFRTSHFRETLACPFADNFDAVL